MSDATIFGLCAAALVGLGVYGLIVNPQPLRKILAFNVVGSGVFLLAGAIARRGAGAGFGGDPVPQALLITGIVVAFSATALAVALLLRLHDATGSVTLSSDAPTEARARCRRPVVAGRLPDRCHDYDARRFAARAGGAGPVRRGDSRAGSRWPQSAAHRPADARPRAGHRAGHRRRLPAFGQRARVPAGRLGAAARRGAARRQPLGGDAGWPSPW